MADTRTPLASIEEALAYHPHLSAEDRAEARVQMVDAGSLDFFANQNSNGGYVGGTNAAGELVVYLWPTYITVTERATKMPVMDPSTGRQTTSNIEPGWDTFLSRWGITGQGGGSKGGPRKSTLPDTGFYCAWCRKPTAGVMHVYCPTCKAKRAA